MARRRSWLGASSLVLAVVLAGCAAAAGGRGTPAATPAPSALPAGTYGSLVFRPVLTYTVPAGWANPADAADYFNLQPVTTDTAGIHVFRDPQAASQDASCPTEPQPGVGTLSSDLARWIRGLQGLTVGNPRIVTVGGLRGTEIDVRIADGWTTSCPFANGIPTVPLFVGSTGSPTGRLRWVVAGTERLRLDLLDVPGGGTVVVDQDAFEGSQMDGLLAAAAPIVASFSFAAP